MINLLWPSNDFYGMFVGIRYIKTLRDNIWTSEHWKTTATANCAEDSIYLLFPYNYWLPFNTCILKSKLLTLINLNLIYLDWLFLTLKSSWEKKNHWLFLQLISGCDSWFFFTYLKQKSKQKYVFFTIWELIFISSHILDVICCTITECMKIKLGLCSWSTTTFQQKKGFGIEFRNCLSTLTINVLHVSLYVPTI